MAKVTRKRQIQRAVVQAHELDTPDVTPVQAISAVSGITGLLMDATVISNGTSKLIVGIASIVLPLAFTWADAHIRHGRATGNTKR